jgi:predicted AlkP superfamily pyrophosphatase or phosphodiesterase
VDALRLDFMIEKKYATEEKVNSDGKNGESPYNKFVNMHSLLRNNASQTAIFGFRADPPTVTSQRLKGNNLKFYFNDILFIYFH